jgi:hypothetical protein
VTQVRHTGNGCGTRKYRRFKHMAGCDGCDAKTTLFYMRGNLRK